MVTSSRSLGYVMGLLSRCADSQRLQTKDRLAVFAAVGPETRARLDGFQHMNTYASQGVLHFFLNRPNLLWIRQRTCVGRYAEWSGRMRANSQIGLIAY